MLLLVDGNSVGWRAFYAMGGLSHGGVPTGMAYGFLRLLRDALAQTQATECRVAWDGGRPAFRTRLLPAYKANRDAADDPERAARRRDFHTQWLWLTGTLPALGVLQASGSGWEADDVLAAWVMQHLSARIVVMSGDRDVWQLVSPTVSVLRPDVDGGGALITDENFAEKTKHASPEQWLWYRVLTGDSSDNIPGVGGIGPKRAAALLANGWPNPPLGWRQLTVSQGENAERNRRLMDLRLSAGTLAKKAGALGVFPAALALGVARQRITAAGMASLTARWTDWSGPFRGLRQ